MIYRQDNLHSIVGQRAAWDEGRTILIHLYFSAKVHSEFPDGGRRRTTVALNFKKRDAGGNGRRWNVSWNLSDANREGSQRLIRSVSFRATDTSETKQFLLVLFKRVVARSKNIHEKLLIVQALPCDPVEGETILRGEELIRLKPRFAYGAISFFTRCALFFCIGEGGIRTTGSPTTILLIQSSLHPPRLCYIWPRCRRSLPKPCRCCQARRKRAIPKAGFPRPAREHFARSRRRCCR